jgi:hypothetical protein
MTFISTVIAKQGIILSADSKELVQGGQLIWKDFDAFLQQKGLKDEDMTPSISPKEITDIFQASSNSSKGRVKSFDGAMKIFQIGSHSAILLSGIANPNGQEFSTLIQRIKDNLAALSDNSFNTILEITFSTIESVISADTSEDKFQSEYLFCGFDESTDTFRVVRFFFNQRWKMDENGQPKKDEKGITIKEKYFAKAENSVFLNTSGWTHYVGELGSLNHAQPVANLRQAFELSKRIIDLVVTIENITNQITGIGGKIYHAVITKEGFFWVNTEADVMNLKQ